jgi:trans-2,3-dihydro-3-hydroxyanthranilate isomerase
VGAGWLSMSVMAILQQLGVSSRDLNSGIQLHSHMANTRRRFLKTLAVSTAASALLDRPRALANPNPSESSRHFHFVQVDVFTSQRLQGNPLMVFTDARGLSDLEMQALARETSLQETTFVVPRDTAVEAQQGVSVRIFTPDEELPFAGHPTLGTAAVLRSLRLPAGMINATDVSPSTIVLDLKVGRVPVSFRQDVDGMFGEMQQVSPLFGQVHNRRAVADALGVDASEIDPDLPIQTVSTGLPFAIVPFKRLNTLQSLHLDFQRVYGYLRRQQNPAVDFYYISRDTGDVKVRLRARSIDPIGEDPATGSAAGCTSAWMVKYGVAKPDETVLIVQGVEIKRPSKLFVRSSTSGINVSNVRVGGHAVQIMEGDASL